MRFPSGCLHKQRSVHHLAMGCSELVPTASTFRHTHVYFSQFVKSKYSFYTAVKRKHKTNSHTQYVVDKNVLFQM